MSSFLALLPSDPWFYIVTTLSVLVYGISKGGFGGVFGMISVPLMSLVMSPLTATAILLPILMLMDMAVIKKFWGQFDKTIVSKLIPAAALGVLLGYLSADLFDDNALKLLVAITALVFGIKTLWANKPSEAAKKDTLLAWIWGTIAGFTSFHVHSGGPPMNAYMLPKRLPPKVYVGTVGVFFFATNWIKLPFYTINGQLTKETLLLALLFAPLAPIGVALGAYLMDKVDPKKYYKWIGVGLVLIGVRLTLEFFGL